MLKPVTFLICSYPIKELEDIASDLYELFIHNSIKLQSTLTCWLIILSMIFFFVNDLIPVDAQLNLSRNNNNNCQ